MSTVAAGQAQPRTASRERRRALLTKLIPSISTLLSARPGRIRSITAVDAPHPRELEVTAQPGFQDMVIGLRNQLTEDEERVARAGGVSE